MLHFARWKIVLIVLVCVAGVLAALPNLLPRSVTEALPGWMPAEPLVLGLDLQGGSHLLLAVETDAVREERLESLRDDIRQALRDERIGYTGLGVRGDAVVVRIREDADLQRARARLEELTAASNPALFGRAVRDAVLTQEEGNLLVLTLTEEGLQQRINSAVEQSIEIVRRRIDELGTTEPTIQRQGADRILVQVPGLQDPGRLKALLGQTAQLTFRLVDVSVSLNEAVQGRPPAGSEVLYYADDPSQPIVVERRTMVAGEDLVDAQPGFDQQTNEPIVSFRFNTSGARRFGQVTQQNVGRPFAIVLDEAVISAPVIREPILGGTGQISGGFTVQQANDLAILLRAGALPAPLTILEERTVGPGLGADSIEAGQTAAMIGVVAVVAFMILSYSLFGVFSVVALALNLSLLIGVLSALQATLTLPGIAGIVLTVGMAVDANVLIFERIREELRAGKSAIGAIDAGFNRAFGTILDANITTLIAAVILFYLGSGPVRGFAITLAIGIVTTVFTAFTVTRLIVALWLRRRRPAAVPI
jgi:protein-export membrane protein SecD